MAINLHYVTTEIVTTQQEQPILTEEPLPANLKLINEIADVSASINPEVSLPVGTKLVQVLDNLPTDLKIIHQTTETIDTSIEVKTEHTVPFLKGVNIAGAEFNSAKRPGIHNTDYHWNANGFIDAILAISPGINVLRIPFLWERLQPNYQQSFSSAEFARLDATVQYITSKGIYCILDPHNYMYRFDKIIGGADCPQMRFYDLWQRLANIYKNNRYVIFGLMNEPKDASPNGTANVMQQALYTIRDAGAENIILVPGTYYTGAQSWVNWGSNSDAYRSFRDPCNNFAIEIHAYFDPNHSGTANPGNPVNGCTGVVSANEAYNVLNYANNNYATSVTKWLRDNGFKGFVGEIGVPRDTTSLQCLTNALQFIKDNSDVYAGWCYWGASEWFNTLGNFTTTPVQHPYYYAVDPINQSRTPQIDVLKQFWDN